MYQSDYTMSFIQEKLDTVGVFIFCSKEKINVWDCGYVYLAELYTEYTCIETPHDTP